MRERKSNVVIVKLSRRERIALDHLSDESGESMSTVFRQLLKQEAERLGVWPTAGDVYTDALGFWPRADCRPAGPKELKELEAAAEAETEGM